MKINDVNSFSVLRTLQTEVQDIAGEIAHSPISPRKYQHLSKKLDHAFEALQDLEEKSKTAILVAKTLKEQFVEHYGNLEVKRLEREVTQIKEEATSLKNGRLTLKAIKKLEMHISDLESTHLTSIPDRRVIADAKQALIEAKAKLEGKPTLDHMKFLAEQKNVQFMESVELLPGDIEELFDIARAIYNRDLRQAKMRYATLPEDHKRRCEKHLQNLIAQLFVDSLETMQALIATVNELVENGESYPSSNDIDQLFLGLAQEGAEEREGSKIVSFRPSV